MGRFLIAQPPRAGVAAARILGDTALREMHRQQVTMHPSIPGSALGFNEDYVGELRVLEHGGNMGGFSALLVLITGTIRELFAGGPWAWQRVQ